MTLILNIYNWEITSEIKSKINKIRKGSCKNMYVYKKGAIMVMHIESITEGIYNNGSRMKER